MDWDDDQGGDTRFPQVMMAAADVSQGISLALESRQACRQPTAAARPESASIRSSSGRIGCSPWASAAVSSIQLA